MSHHYYGNSDALEALSEETSMSPEEFLLYLEQVLDTGELTLDEAIQLIRDYNNRD